MPAVVEIAAGYSGDLPRRRVERGARGFLVANNC